MPHPPRIAFEVWDASPEDWPDWAVEPYRDVIADPAGMGKKGSRRLQGGDDRPAFEERRSERHGQEGGGRGHRGQGGFRRRHRAPHRLGMRQRREGCPHPERRGGGL